MESAFVVAFESQQHSAGRCAISELSILVTVDPSIKMGSNDVKCNRKSLSGCTLAALGASLGLGCHIGTPMSISGNLVG